MVLVEVPAAHPPRRDPAIGVTAKMTNSMRQIPGDPWVKSAATQRLGWAPNRSGIEKRQGAARPSVASDGRQHAEP